MLKRKDVKVLIISILAFVFILGIAKISTVINSKDYTEEITTSISTTLETIKLKETTTTKKVVPTTKKKETTTKVISLEEKVKSRLGNYSLETEMIAKVLYREARGIPDKAQVAAVGWCILNRVDSPNYSNSIIEVITAPAQFAWYEDTYVEPELLWLAEDIVYRWLLEKEGVKDSGRTLPQDYFFFEGDGQYNYFRQYYDSTEIWDWSLSSPY